MMQQMVKNLNKEMHSVSDWLGIQFTNDLLKRTLPNGDIAFVDSSLMFSDRDSWLIYYPEMLWTM